MGMPPTWSILSLTNYFCASRARKNKKKSPFRVKGDDLIAYWKIGEIQRYKALMSQFGYIVKPGSSWVNRHRGTYCEDPYEIRGGFLMPLEGYYSLRAFVKRERKSPWDGTLEEFALADLCHKYVETVPRSIICSLQSIFFSHIFGTAWSMNIDPFVPRLFGGLGFVPLNPSKRPKLRYQRIAHYIHNHPMDDRLQMVLQSYPPRSQGRAVANRLRRSENLQYTVEGATKWVCTEDELTPLRMKTYGIYLLNEPVKPVKLSRFLKVLVKRNRKLRSICGTFFVRRRNYDELYALEKRIKPIKVVYDALCEGSDNYPSVGQCPWEEYMHEWNNRLVETWGKTHTGRV